MLLLLQQAILKAPPAVTDSLKNSLAQMQHRIDSLEKVVTKTEIGTGFFTDALATNLTVFAAIIGLSALISWGYFSLILRNQKNEINKRVKKYIDDHEKTQVERYTELQKQLKVTIFDVHRAMYFNVCNDDDKYNAFTWAFACAESSFNLDPENHGRISLWLDKVILNLASISVGDSDMIEQIDRSRDRIGKLETIENPDIKTKVRTIKRDVFHIVYSKPQPPSNLMEFSGDELPF